MRTPKLLSEQFGNSLVSFHKHGSTDCLLIVRQCQLYRHDGLRQGEDLVHTHVDIGRFQQAFQFLVDFQGHKADAYVCFYTASSEVENRANLNLRLS